MGRHATLAQRWFSEVWAPGGEALVDSMLARDAVGQMEGRDVNGSEDFKLARRELLAVFPDLRVYLEQVIEQDDQVAMRWTVTATHSGDGLGVPATNRPVSFRGMTWWEVRDGKIVRGWDSWNLGGLIQSLQPSAEPSQAVGP